MTLTALSEGVKTGDPNHAGLHNAERQHINIVHAIEGYVPSGGNLQAAIDAAQTIGTGSGVVRLGPGVWTYDMAPLITHPEGLHIKGSGPYRTLLLPAAGVDGLQVQAARFGHRFKISDLSIEGGANGVHILPGGETELSMERVEMIGQSGVGLLTETGTYAGRLVECGFSGMPVGIKTTVFGHIWRLDTCRFHATTDTALDLFRARAWYLDACHFENNVGNVARMHRCHTVHFEGGWLEQNGIVADAPLFIVTGDTSEWGYDISFQEMFLSEAPTVFLDASDAYVNRVSLVRQAINACEVRLPGGRVYPYAPGEGHVVSLEMVENYQYGASGTLWRVNVAADGTESRVQVSA